MIHGIGQEMRGEGWENGCNGGRVRLLRQQGGEEGSIKTHQLSFIKGLKKINKRLNKLYWRVLIMPVTYYTYQAP